MPECDICSKELRNEEVYGLIEVEAKTDGMIHATRQECSLFVHPDCYESVRVSLYPERYQKIYARSVGLESN